DNARADAGMISTKRKVQNERLSLNKKTASPYAYGDRFRFVHLRAREACVRQGHTIFLLYGNAVSYKANNGAVACSPVYHFFN
ncbi:MAG: hypothetical protein IKM24_00495, partial [Clostridia bacterium]|nr:hypothetical protein [Clostridia bacterium]